MKKVLFSSLLIATSLFSMGVKENIENSILSNNNGKYEVTGYFAPYHFSEDSKSNWTFTFANGAGTYQLLGDTENGIGIFGWVKKDVIPNEPAYYMVNYESSPFGWVLFDVDSNGNCKNIFKLAGQDPVTKSFSYDLDDDGKVDILDGISCNVSGNNVEFYSPSNSQYEDYENNSNIDSDDMDSNVNSSDSSSFKAVDIPLESIKNKKIVFNNGNSYVEIYDNDFKSFKLSDGHESGDGSWVYENKILYLWKDQPYEYTMQFSATPATSVMIKISERNGQEVKYSKITELISISDGSNNNIDESISDLDPQYTISNFNINNAYIAGYEIDTKNKILKVYFNQEMDSRSGYTSGDYYTPVTKWEDNYKTFVITMENYESGGTITLHTCDQIGCFLTKDGETIGDNFIIVFP